VVAEVQSEIERIVNLYQQNQMEHVKLAQLRGDLALYQKGEILNEIISIEAYISDQDPTAIGVAVKIRTATGEEQELFVQTNIEGVSVSA